MIQPTLYQHPTHLGSVDDQVSTPTLRRPSTCKITLKRGVIVVHTIRRSAFVLDVIAISALVIYVSRVVLGYKQTWDRYQLLVNRTLYEKTLASGFGSVHFLLDASEQQQYKEAILVYALLLHSEKNQVSCRSGVRDACERFIYDRFKKKIEMPIDKAVNTLLRLDLVSEISLKESTKLEVVPCSRACSTLKQRWDRLLEQET